MSTTIRPTNSKNLDVDVPTSEALKRASAHTDNNEALKLIASFLPLAKEHDCKMVSRVTVMEPARMLAEIVNASVIQPTNVAKVLPALAVQSAKSQGDQARKLLLSSILQFLESA